MITSSHPIAGGDFAAAGCASRGLKDRLRRIGVEAETMRRVMIAAYEAEMNVVIHARRGNLWARFDDRRLELEIVDEGPGIADVAQAMKPGFSTASAEARALGFGAGMGLPNIRRASDAFEISSEPGRGTTLRATIFLRSQLRDGGFRTSLRLDGERCVGCLSCLKACPTRAIRLRDGRPCILERLCVDCTACIAACPHGVFSVTPSGESEPETAGNAGPVTTVETGPQGKPVAAPGTGEQSGPTLIVPRAFLTHFGPEASPSEVLACLLGAGYREVRFSEEWEDALRAQVRRIAADRPDPPPLISPLCPAAVNLVELQFPALIPNLAPYLSPVEAAREELAAGGAPPESLCFVPACPSQRTCLQARDSSQPVRQKTVGELTLEVLSGLGRDRAPAGGEGSRREATTAEAADPPLELRVLTVTGLAHVIRVLEQAEKGLLQDFQVLEPALCPQGCFGSPEFATDAFVASSRWQAAGPTREHRAEARPRGRGYLPRAGARLDPDMGRAIAKLGQVEEIARRLPGRDCAACGAPGCSQLAEDIVLGRATREACPFGQASDAGAKERGKEVTT